MKIKSTKLMLTLIMAATIFQGCKKGENDPLISLRSRDARLSGTWVMSNAVSSNVYTYFTISTGTAEVTTANQNYDGHNYTTVNTTTNAGVLTASSTVTSPYSYEVKIDNDGTYTSTTISDGLTDIKTGLWAWANDGKDKSHLLLGDMIYKVDELREKDLVLVVDNTSKDTKQNGNYSTDIRTYKLTYSKK